MPKWFFLQRLKSYVVEKREPFQQMMLGEMAIQRPKLKSVSQSHIVYKTNSKQITDLNVKGTTKIFRKKIGEKIVKK